MQCALTALQESVFQHNQYEGPGYKMFSMVRSIVILTFLLSSVSLWAFDKQQPSYPSFEYDVAKIHEIKPHRRTIPHEGVRAGFNQLRLTLTVSPTGEVLDADANGDKEILKLWPKLKSEVLQWKFLPFTDNGKAITAQVEEYLNLVPPERHPKLHVTPPVLRADSQVAMTLSRSGCMGSCPAYTVTVSTEGIVFDGGFSVVAAGKHRDTASPTAVRELAKKFIDDDFYSMEEKYVAGVTDCPTYVLSISIDGHNKEVMDYVGEWEGMPGVIAELEEDVDTFARTERWIEGGKGLVEALKAEKYDFTTVSAQVILKEAATRGEVATMKELLQAGVPLRPLPAPKPKESYMGIPFDHVGWLNAASRHGDALQVFIDAGASKHDQEDKDLALVQAADSGDVSSVRALIGYGANPNVDLSKLIVTESGGGMTMQGQGAGSVLIKAAHSGNPDMVREILRYHPNLEAKDREGKTAIFAAGDYLNTDKDGARVECIRLLIQAGANVNARDDDGNTPLHETFLTDVEEELLRLGANVNAQNSDGETPIFTTVDDEAIPLFIAHGADLSIHNKKGQTVVQAAQQKGPQRQEVLRNAIQGLNQRPQSNSK